MRECRYSLHTNLDSWWWMGKYQNRNYCCCKWYITETKKTTRNEYRTIIHEKNEARAKTMMQKLEQTKKYIIKKEEKQTKYVDRKRRNGSIRNLYN